MAAFGEAIAAAQAVAGANAVVDGLILGVGWAVFGWAGLCAAWDFAKAMIRADGATSDDEIRLSARLAVAALVSIGLMVFLHKFSGKLKRVTGDAAPPKSDVPPDRGRPRPQNSQPPSRVPPIRRSNLRADLSDDWFDPQTGKIVWPENDGFLGSSKADELLPDTMIDRYGEPTGNFLSPAGTDFGARALPYDPSNMKYSVYKVIKTLPVQSGTAAPWFGEPGMGTQYLTSDSVEDLINQGYLEDVTP